VAAEHGFDMVHFDFVGGGVLKNQVVINMGEILNLIRNPKTHPKWVKSSNFGLKLMKYWLQQPILHRKMSFFKIPFFD
jgi:hypothetical protein